MKRGEAEKACFELVRNNLKRENYFAMSIEDGELIEKAFSEAIENPNASSFPDFVFDDGFIEHFRVTSSFENRKGSTMVREKADINRSYQQKFEDAIKKQQEEGVVTNLVATDPYWHAKHTYENFVDSFKKNYENHINSLRKYKGPCNQGIFMIEYKDSTLCMHKKYPDNLKTGVSYGDLMDEDITPYRISRDMELLIIVPQ